MTYQEVLEQARTCMGKCHACPVCSGLTCKNMVPGPGAKELSEVAGALRQHGHHLRKRGGGHQL